MSRLIVLFCAITYVCADVKQLHQDQLDLFKYDPSDAYSLPEDIDDDKPATIFHGDVMQAKTERLQSLTGNKKFKLDLKTQNGIEVSSVGKLRDDKTFVVSGSYSFTGADGKRYRTRYTADEFGYHPITELDLDIPEPQPLAQAGAGANRLQSSLNSDDKFGFAGFKNRFQFLNQNLDSQDDTQGPYGGSLTSGDDYSYDKPSNGYTYDRPEQEFESRSPSEPSRQYLPVQ